MIVDTDNDTDTDMDTDTGIFLLHQRIMTKEIGLTIKKSGS